MQADPSRRGFLGLNAAKPVSPGITIGSACLSARGIICQSCADHCPEAAISFRPRLAGVPELVLDDARCTACGDCVPVCPVGAIAVHSRHV
jgi:ferredoxin-type protein NapF